MAQVLQGNPTTRLERVRLAHVLRAAGIPRGEIAERLSVSPDTVRDYLRRPRHSRLPIPSVCGACGKPSSRPGRLCVTCFRGSLQVWDRDTVVSVLAKWPHGTLTLAQLDHGDGTIRAAQKAGHLPSGRTARRRFTSEHDLADTLRAARASAREHPTT